MHTQDQGFTEMASERQQRASAPARGRDYEGAPTRRRFLEWLCPRPVSSELAAVDDLLAQIEASDHPRAEGFAYLFHADCSDAQGRGWSEKHSEANRWLKARSGDVSPDVHIACWLVVGWCSAVADKTGVGIVVQNHSSLAKKFGDSGRHGYYSTAAKRIVISENRLDTPIKYAMTIAHELGHALEPITPEDDETTAERLGTSDCEKLREHTENVAILFAWRVLAMFGLAPSGTPAEVRSIETLRWHGNAALCPLHPWTRRQLEHALAAAAAAAPIREWADASPSPLACPQVDDLVKQSEPGLFSRILRSMTVWAFCAVAPTRRLRRCLLRQYSPNYDFDWTELGFRPKDWETLIGDAYWDARNRQVNQPFRERIVQAHRAELFLAMGRMIPRPGEAASPRPRLRCLVSSARPAEPLPRSTTHTGSGFHRDGVRTTAESIRTRPRTRL